MRHSTVCMVWCLHMQKISKERAAKIATKVGGGPRPESSERVYKAVLELDVGESLLVSNADWGIKSPPYWNVNRVAARRGSKARFSCRTLKNEAGWIITRIQ